jgi:hypothetical protein
VKHSVPRSAARSPRLRESRKRFLRKEAVSTRRKLRSEPGTHEVRVHVYRSGGRSRSNASRVLSTGRSQGLVVGSRALAGRKLEAPPDAGHEPREGETVCGKALIPKKCALSRFAGLLAGFRYDGRCSRACARLALTGGATQGSFGSQVNLRHTIREERVPGSASVGTEAGRACLRVTTEHQMVDTVR